MRTYEYYIKFGSLNSEWVDSWNLGGFPLPLPPPDKQLPPPPFTDSVVQLRYSRLLLALQTIMVTGMTLDNATLVKRDITDSSNPKVIMVLNFQKVIIDSCLPATEIVGPRIYYGWDNVSIDVASYALAPPPALNPRYLTLGPRAFS